MAFLRRTRQRRALVLGLDCADPDLVFGQLCGELPTLARLMDGGMWGRLRSSTPCITVPAWSSMMSSRDAGELGLYGFRNRAAWDYQALASADSRAVPYPRLWDTLGEFGKRSLVVNVPQTYPVKPINGALVSCFLTPNTSASFTYPAILKAEVLKHAPHYDFDVRDFRTPDKASLYQRLLDFTAVQYDVLEHLLVHPDIAWDFAIHVNMGTDRLHHGFWRYHDPRHRLHEPNSPFRYAIRDYYRLVDERIGRVVERLPEDTLVLVVSDHGALRMDGAIAINQWLWQNGWLALKEAPRKSQIVAFRPELVDWSKTRAWSTGGYYGRIFLNVQGREPQGMIAPQDVQATRQALAEAIATISDHEGNPLHHRVIWPEQVYRQVRGYAPDLMIYFGDLHWRAVGGLGYPEPTTLENDAGPDDANHAEEGLFILYDPRQRAVGQREGANLLDVAPTLLHRLGLRPLPDMQGQVWS
ncbi:MAG: alkaline phosphatase family protein [Anaerolineae bacterium]|nr:alkaline phosphatase family protein [Anaerolineae bacterium]MDW8172460.1 alkaline phosphatase family protein [Anaerolineae bacterium]